MIALIFSPLYIFFTWLLAFMLIRWVKACTKKDVRIWLKILIYGFFSIAAGAMPVAFVLPDSILKNKLQHFGSLWLGILLYSLFPALLYLIFCLIWRIVKKRKNSTASMERPRQVAITAASAGIIFVVIICIYGMFHAVDTRITEYSVTAPKKNGSISELNAVMVADMHMGVNIGVKEMQRMVERINECDPDIVFICGDIFDNSYEALDDPEELINIYKQIKSRYGIYACYGNHDVVEPILAGFTFNYSEKKESDPRMDEFLEKAGVKLLIDEAVLVEDSFYVYGRPDKAKPGRGIDRRKSPEEIMEILGDEYPVIVLDHEPKELYELAEAGVDIDLCGHTHDGQIFPGNILLSLLNDNSYGYKKFGNMENIVTSGVGLFGPFMRVGTISEICKIKISFI